MRSWAALRGRPDIMANPFEFIQDVRTEAAKVTWPTRRETLITTGMVLIMVVLAAVFFVVGRRDHPLRRVARPRLRPRPLAADAG